MRLLEGKLSVSLRFPGGGLPLSHGLREGAGARDDATAIVELSPTTCQLGISAMGISMRRQRQYDTQLGNAIGCSGQFSITRGVAADILARKLNTKVSVEI